MTWVFIIAAYLLGSIPSGVLLARVLGLADPRTVGSGNIGAANLTRLGGLRLGAATLILDGLKGLLPIGLMMTFGPDKPPEFLYPLLAVAAVIGHCYSIYLGFRGGKAVATAAGAFLLLEPLAVLISIGAWAVSFWSTRISALASLMASLAMLATIAARNNWNHETGAAFFVTALIFWRHRENIARLLQQRELKF